MLPDPLPFREGLGPILSLPAVSFLRLTHRETPELTQQLSITFSLAQSDAY